MFELKKTESVAETVMRSAVR